jgi:hypothetical protein
MGYFFKISNAFRNAVFETGYDDNFINEHGCLTKEQQDELLGIIMKKMKGTCNPKTIRDFIEMEYSI